MPTPHSWRGPVDEVVGGHSETIPVDGLEPALVAPGLSGGHRTVDEVGLVVPGLDHGPNEREAAVPLVFQDRVLRLCHEGFVVRLALARAVRAAPGRDGNGAGEGDAGRAHREQREAGPHGQCSSQSHEVTPFLGLRFSSEDDGLLLSPPVRRMAIDIGTQREAVNALRCAVPTPPVAFGRRVPLEWLSFSSPVFLRARGGDVAGD